MRAPLACANTALLARTRLGHARHSLRPEHLQPQPTTMASPSSAPSAPRLGHERPTRQLCHQCFSWAVSGADDTSPCCEQINLLRVDPRIQQPPQDQQQQPDTRTIPLRPSLARLASESKGFLGICSIPCSHSNTASLAGNIAVRTRQARTLPACQRSNSATGRPDRGRPPRRSNLRQRRRESAR